MNTETENNEGSDNKLQGAFGDKGTNVNAGMSYAHPHGEKIMKEAKAVLYESETGQALLKVFDHYQFPLQIMKGTGEGGFSPNMKTIILQVPSKTQKASGEFILELAKSIRQAEQDAIGNKAPDPRTDIIKYSGFIHARNLDSIWHLCKLTKELTNSSHFSVLLDSLTVLGLNTVYKAFLEGVSKEGLYEYYAEAYNNRGSR